MRPSKTAHWVRLGALAPCALALTACVTTAERASSRSETAATTHALTEPSPALAADMAERSSKLRALGLRQSEVRFAGFLPAGDHATFAFDLDHGQCATFIARATRNVRDADAAIYTPEGELLAVDSEPDAHPTIQACAQDGPARVYYVLQVVDGDGSFLVVPFLGTVRQLQAAARVSGGRPALAAAVRSSELQQDDPVATLAEGLRKRGYQATGQSRVFTLASKERVRTPLLVERGQCYTIAAFGGPGVQDLGLRVLDDGGRAVSVADTNMQHAAAQLCARDDSAYAVESEAREGEGEVRIFTYRADVVAAGGDAGLWLGRAQEAAAKPSHGASESGSGASGIEENTNSLPSR